MIYLHPQVIAAHGSGTGPGAQLLEPFAIFEHDIAGTLELSPVDHYVAGNQQPGTTLRPAAVETLMANGRPVKFVGEPLGHRRLTDSVGDYCTARKHKIAFEFTGHRYVLLNIVNRRLQSAPGSIGFFDNAGLPVQMTA
jgi:hypothetical protein